MLPVELLIKCDVSNAFKTIQALKIMTPDKVENFELIESHFLVQLKEHILAIPREYWKQTFHLFDIIKH